MPDRYKQKGTVAAALDIRSGKGSILGIPTDSIQLPVPGLSLPYVIVEGAKQILRIKKDTYSRIHDTMEIQEGQLSKPYRPGVYCNHNALLDN